MVHKHFEEHKNQLFAGKKLKKHDRLPKGQKQKKLRQKCSLVEYDTTVQFAEKYHSMFRFAPSIVECYQQVALAWCYQGKNPRYRSIKSYRVLKFINSQRVKIKRKKE